MKEIGDIFKEKREEIGITIEEVASDLKIDSVLIDNLEDGNDRAFKDILEVKDIIKAYAKYLGIDADDILEDYQDYLFEKTSRISVSDIKEGIEKTERLNVVSEQDDKKVKSPYTINNNFDNDKKIVVILSIVILFVLIIMYIIVKNYILG